MRIICDGAHDYCATDVGFVSYAKLSRRRVRWLLFGKCMRYRQQAAFEVAYYIDLPVA